MEVPRISLRLARGDRKLQRRILLCVVHTPFLAGMKNVARFMLALNYQEANEAEKAEVQYRTILGNRAARSDPGFESAVRRRLADAIETLGRPHEAEVERKRALGSIRGGQETALSLQVRANMFEQEHRYADAYAMYERALALTPRRQKAMRVGLMLRLALSAFSAGQPADSIQWADAAIELDQTGPQSATARQLAAAASANLGRLEDAERYIRGAVEMAATAETRAHSLALMAEYVMRRGDLDGAERIARDAEKLAPGRKRMPWVVIATALEQRGRFEEAIQRSTMPPRSERAARRPETVARWPRSRSTRRVLQAELGRFDQALALLRTAESEFAGDIKTTVKCDVSGGSGPRAAARPRRGLAPNRFRPGGAAKIPDDVATQRSVTYYLGRAALAIDETARAETFLNVYLELQA